MTDRFISSISLGCGPRIQERRGAHQVVCDDAEPDPASGAVRAMISTASQTMSSLEHTDSAFAPDTPALTAAEPTLSFVRAPRRGFPSRSRQNHSSDTAYQRRVFVFRGSKAAIGGGQIRGCLLYTSDAADEL